MRGGLDIQSAIVKTDGFIHFDRARPEPSPRAVEVSAEAEIAAQNDAALKELQQMLGRIA